MADQSHLDILRQGVEVWNSWKGGSAIDVVPDLSEAELDGVDLRRTNLSGADLSGADLSGAELFRANLSEAKLSWAKLSGAMLSDANLRGAKLSGANLSDANLLKADLSGADLTEADLSLAHLTDAMLFSAKLTGAILRRTILSPAGLTEADLSGADLTEADLTGANLTGANLRGANLRGADLSMADLSMANLSCADLTDANLTRSALVETNLTGTTLTGCSIYGISAWSLKLEGATQHNLNVSPYGEPTVMVDNLEVAQFVYLLLNNERIRQVIDTITSKAVLILGRFTSDRKAVLDAMREELRQRGYLPILFDFANPAGRDLTETISTLAHMARFIIADITEAKSIPQELQAIVPNLPSVPVQPLLLTSEREYGMFEHFRRYPWVLDTYYYDNLDEVLASIEDKVIFPAETKARELSS
jgi:uncharacterized protein YjbI with pentapeptide repeats